MSPCAALMWWMSSTRPSIHISAGTAMFTSNWWQSVATTRIGSACWRKRWKAVNNAIDVSTARCSFWKKRTKSSFWASVEAFFSKLKTDGCVHANLANVLMIWKRSSCVFFTKKELAKWPILHIKTAHSEEPKGSFNSTEWAVLRCKMNHFEKREAFFFCPVRFFYRFKSNYPPKMTKKSCSFLRYIYLTKRSPNSPSFVGIAGAYSVNRTKERCFAHRSFPKKLI